MFPPVKVSLLLNPIKCGIAKNGHFLISQFHIYKFLNFTEVSKYSIGELRRGPGCGGVEGGKWLRRRQRGAAEG